MASSAKEKKYRGVRTKDFPVMEPEFDEHGNQTRASMMYGRIDSAYLTRLLMERKAQMAPFLEEQKELAKTDKEAAKALQPPMMSDKLAEVLLIIIKKTLGLKRWRTYSDDWKEEMFAHALLLSIRYVHRFDPEKLATNGKSNDPYFYVGMIAWNAFNQIWNKKHKQSQRITYIPLNEGIYHGVVAMDQYAGVLEREEKRKAEERKADLANEGLGLDETVDIMKELEESTSIQLTEDDLKPSDDSKN